jgi:hypothetical protein
LQEGQASSTAFVDFCSSCQKINLMMNRDEYVIALRPKVVVVLEDQDNEVETFMHKTLRPILKFQHPLLIRCIKAAPHFDQLVFKVEREKKNRDALKAFLQKNSVLKAQLTGLVIALLTESEMDCYERQPTELNKRILEMVMTRFLSEY